MGRINFGDWLEDRKGITDCVMLGQTILHEWTIYSLPLDDLSALKFAPLKVQKVSQLTKAGESSDGELIGSCLSAATGPPREGVAAPLKSTHLPAFFRGYFEVDNPQDSFFATDGWTKGVCWINGFNIGRYWKRGPQQTLYVPKPLFKKGQNEIILLELDGASQYSVEFYDKAILASL